MVNHKKDCLGFNDDFFVLRVGVVLNYHAEVIFQKVVMIIKNVKAAVIRVTVVLDVVVSMSVKERLDPNGIKPNAVKVISQLSNVVLKEKRLDVI